MSLSADQKAYIYKLVRSSGNSTILSKELNCWEQCHLEMDQTIQLINNISYTFKIPLKPSIGQMELKI